MPDPSALRRISPVTRWGVGLGLLLALYLAIPSANYGFDGVYFAMCVEGVAAGVAPAAALFPKHYVLYPSLAYGLYRVLAGLGLRLETWYLLTLLAALAALGVLAGVARWLRAQGTPPALALVVTAGLAASYGFWYYATEAEVYTLCLLGLLGAYAGAERAGAAAGEPGQGWRPAAGAGLAWGLAMTVHLGPVASLPALAWALGRSRPGRGRRLAAAGGVGAAVVLAAYFVKFRIMDGIPFWAGLYGTIREKLTASAYSEYSVVFGWDWTAPGTMLATMARGLSPVPGLGWLALAACLAGLAPLATPAGRRDPHRQFLALALAGNFLFYCAYYPWNIEAVPFFLLPLAGLLAAGGTAVPAPHRRPTLLALGGLVGALALGNFVGAILPQSDPAHNRAWRAARFIGETTAPEDLVLLVGEAELGELQVYLPYFFRRDVVMCKFLFAYPRASEAAPYAGLARRLAATAGRGGRVYALGDLARDAAARDHFVRYRHLDPARFAAVFPLEAFTPAATGPDGLVLYQFHYSLDPGEGEPAGPPPAA